MQETALQLHRASVQLSSRTDQHAVQLMQQRLQFCVECVVLLLQFLRLVVLAILLLRSHESI